MEKRKTRKGNGEGSIMKIAPGKWKATITVGRDEDGKIKRKVFYGKTKEEAKDKADKYRLANKSGLLLIDDKITLQEWVRTWIFEYMANKLKSSSLARYEGIYRNYIKDTSLGKIKLKDLKPSHLQNYYNTLVRQNGKTASTVKTLNKLLKAAMAQALFEKYILTNPCNHVNLPKVKSITEVEIFTLEEQAQFIDALQGHRQKLLFLMALSTGLRIAELLGLRWADIDMESGELTVNQTLRREVKIDISKGEKSEGMKTEIQAGTPKTESSRRSIPLLPEIITELRLHKIRQNEERTAAGLGKYIDNDLVFPNEIGEPTDARNLTRSYKRVLDRAGIKYKKFHALRHTFATRLFERGVPLITVSKLLGHSDTSITADIYTHVMPEEKIKAIEKLNDLFSPKAP
jgi:integrase